MESIIEIDIIILSYAQNEELKMTTINCIKSLVDSEDPQLIKFNTIVVESKKDLAPYQYDYTTTLYPEEEFGYHKFMNIGIRFTSARYVCLCNNDLLFKKGWASEILMPFKQYTDIYSASPICSLYHPTIGIKLNTGLRLGYKVREHVAGWCIFFRRDLLDIIGFLDPNFRFWYADNDYINTLWTLNLNHVLVTSSVVDHLENVTLNNQTPEVRESLKDSIYYEKKWTPKMGETWTEL